MAEQRCELTELLVDQCGCKDHRNSEIGALLDLTGLRLTAFTDAQFDGRCGLNEDHFITEGERIGKIETNVSHGTVGEATWVCNRCVRAIKGHSS